MGYPVVVWIHGGGFESGGSGAAWGHNGTQHVEASGGEVIWVSIAYRLNVFGFLGAAELRARDALGSTGNYGLQDQREALRWVQRSIGAFGGDPSRVTLDGCSAGAGSTANHATNHANHATNHANQPASQPSSNPASQPAGKEEGHTKCKKDKRL